MQDYSNSIADALELLQPCTKPSINLILQSSWSWRSIPAETDSLFSPWRQQAEISLCWEPFHSSWYNWGLALQVEGCSINRYTPDPMVEAAPESHKAWSKVFLEYWRYWFTLPYTMCMCLLNDKQVTLKYVTRIMDRSELNNEQIWIQWEYQWEMYLSVIYQRWCWSFNSSTCIR